MEARYLLSLALAALVLIGPTLAAHEEEHQDELVETIDMESYKLHRVQWEEAEGGYERIVAQCGDHVEFMWDGKLHNVGVADKGNCAVIRNGSESAMSGKLHYVLDEAMPEVAQNGEVYFACNVGSHCEGGQKIEFMVEGCELGAAAPAGAAAYTDNNNSASARGAVGVAFLLASAGVAALLAA